MSSFLPMGYVDTQLWGWLVGWFFFLEARVKIQSLLAEVVPFKR